MASEALAITHRILTGQAYTSDLLYCNPKDNLSKFEVLMGMCLGHVRSDLKLNRPIIQLFLTAMNVIVGYRDTPEIKGILLDYVPMLSDDDAPDAQINVAWAYQILGFSQYEIFDDSGDDEQGGDGSLDKPNLAEVIKRLRRHIQGTDLPNNAMIFQALIIVVLNAIMAGVKPDFKGLNMERREADQQDDRDLMSERQAETTRRHARPG